MPTILIWIIAIASVFWILSVVDAFRSKSKDRNVWIAVTILLHLLGTLLYFFIGMEKDSFFRSYLRKQFANLLSSIRSISLLSLTAFLDIMFYISAALCFYVFYIVLKIKAEPLNALDLDALKASMTESVVNETLVGNISGAVDVMQSFFINTVIYIIILAVALILVYSIFNSLIWAIISKSKFSMKFFTRFLSMFSMLATILIIILFLTAFFTGEYALDLAPYILLVFFYFAYIAFFHFIRTQKMFSSLKGMLDGILGFPKLAVPLAFLATIYLLIFAAYFYISMLGIAILNLIFYAVAMVLFLSFARLFLYRSYLDCFK